jgi:tetratricopeptide (TPR) repeat protein
LKDQTRDLRERGRQTTFFFDSGAATGVGMSRAQWTRVTDDSVKQRRELEAQVERWTNEARKLAEAGKEAEALELYRRAADQLSGAPWLQNRTAELARKLKKGDVAIAYFRRAATAFQIADFPKRAVPPLRTAWSLSIEGLPGTSRLLVDVALELMQVHRRLGFAADATVTFERTNAALRARGFSEVPAHVLDSMQRRDSEIAPRASDSSLVDSEAEPARGHALARLHERR